MPRATTDTTSTERFPLKTCKGDGVEDPGYVELRKMTFGQVTERRDMASNMSMQGIDESGKTDDLKVTIDTIQKAVIAFEFATCIADHNLLDVNGLKLNFSNPAHVEKLDPLVGQEINDLIEDMNQWSEAGEGNESETSEVE